MSQKIGYPAWAEIDLDRINQNVTYLAKKSGVPLFPVVKANAYGHGAVMVAKTLAKRKEVAALSVMTVAEAAELRDSGYKGRIVLLGGPPPGQAALIADLDLETVVSDKEAVMALVRGAGKKTVKVHLKVDTGMARLGAALDQALGFYQQTAAKKKIAIVGLMTHFAAADEDPGMTQAQIARFDDFCSSVTASGLILPPRCVANTAAILAGVGSYDAARPGLGIYGLSPFAGEVKELKPALTLRSRLMMVRQVERGTPVSYGMTWKSPGAREVGVASIGYADGYPRALSNQARAIMNGSYIKQVGAICMDQTLFDITGKKVKPGDIVTLWGEEGEKKVSVAELVKITGAIPYELVCGLGRRVARIYQKGGRRVGEARYL